MKKEGQEVMFLPLLAAVILCMVLALYESGSAAFLERGIKTLGSGMTPWEREREAPTAQVIENYLPNIRRQIDALPEVFIRNDTSFSVDKNAELARNVRVKAAEGISVIIVHTHGTEAYTPDGRDTYKESDSYRTLNENQNVLRVGEELKSVLEKRGIKTVHYKDLCDYPSYSGAYDRSFDVIEGALHEHPEAQVVIDLHRDAVITAGGSYYKAACDINGKTAAQIEFVCGTDEGGLKHPNWRDNLSFQLYLQQRVELEFPGLMRPLNIRRARFNQHFRTGSMLVEIGTCANTLEEALYSAQLFGEVLAQVLSE